MIAFVMPTRDRPEEVRRTLGAIAALADGCPTVAMEVVIADNASAEPVTAPGVIAGRVPVRVVRLERNKGAAARNDAAAATDESSRWIVMLDDDSHPLDGGLVAALEQAERDARVAAVAAEIVLPPGPDGVQRREAGGLPEVFIGCGVAIRRQAFLKLGGYDASFDYYAEEYDLAARLIRAGYRVEFDRRFRVMHRKVSANRRFGRIMRRLVRNNGWVVQRYAPGACRLALLQETVVRYGRIALKEGVVRSYAMGLAELGVSLLRQPREALGPEQFDRLTGVWHARRGLRAASAAGALGRVAIVNGGKNEWAVRLALAELGVERLVPAARADTLVIGTLSPGPMLDAYDVLAADVGAGAKRVVVPWSEGLLAKAPVVAGSEGAGSGGWSAKPSAGLPGTAALAA